ncbi:MAG: riboflavin biosynthesis protein RibF [Elusimicrobiales bacterium]
MRNFIAVGTFDGVHLGHREVIAELSARARASGMKSLAVYFPIPPKAFLSGKPEQSMITLPGERGALLKQCGADAAVSLEFTRGLAAMSCERFLDEVLVKKLRAGGILAGQDFAFGAGRQGHVNWLRRECETRGIELVVLHFVKAQGHKISSTQIRQYLHEGLVEEAAELLGRPYSLKGTVVRGKGLGRKLGYPTANLDAGACKILPRGVFAVHANVRGERFNAVANIGFRPTVNPIHSHIPLCEVHILDFMRDIYDEEVEIDFSAKIRNEAKFYNLSELVSGIKADISAVRQLLHCRAG